MGSHARPIPAEDRMRIHPIVSLILITMTPCVQAQGKSRFNYDETKVPKYAMIDPLVMADGTPIRQADSWPR